MPIVPPVAVGAFVSTRGSQSTIAIPGKGGARRVAVVYEGVEYGGTEEYILLKMRHLDPARYQPIVVMTASNFRHCPPRFLERLRELHFPVVFPLESERVQTSGLLQRVVHLGRVFREMSVDVVHIHTQQPHGGRVATLAARMAKVGAVFRSEHLPPSSNLTPLLRYTVKPFDALTDAIISGSDSCMREHFSLLGRDPRKAIRLYYGIELQRFSPHHDVAAAKRKLGLDPATPTIGMIARLSPEKGHVYLMDAAALLLKEHGAVNFLLVGDGTLEGALRKQAADLGIADRVHFLGFASDTVPFLEAMDITVMSSISEGISLSMLESMAMGKPVVSTDEPSFMETVIDGESGVIVSRENPSSLASGLLRVLRDGALAQRLGRGAHQRVHDLFHIETNVRLLSELYDEALSPRRGLAKHGLTAHLGHRARDVAEG